MRRAFAHDAVVAVEPGGDERAMGAAITVALCGHWEHEPPCPLAPHHTAVERVGEQVQLRVLFAAEPTDEQEVRSRIRHALSTGFLDGPNGVTQWRLHTECAGEVRAQEGEHAARLARS
jgi:hypothetical protein